MILLLCYCECFELCVTSVTAVTRHNIFVFPPRKYRQAVFAVNMGRHFPDNLVSFNLHVAI